MTRFSTIIRTSAVGAATALALGLLMLDAGTGPAVAAFPGTNGKIVFNKRAENETSIRIATMSPDGGGLTTYLPGPGRYGSGPLWSPDGTRLVFQDYRDGNREIYTMNADGSEVRRLTNNPATDSGADWSPDGTKIAFESVRDGDGEVYAMNADGTNETNLTNNPGYDFFPRWQPIPRCTIVGSQGNDKLRGTAGKDVICGLASDDTLSGWEGDDILISGKGNDAVYGGADNDTLNGGPGTDAVSYLGAATAVAASLTTNFATGQGSDVFVGIEDLTGTAFEDTLEGSSRANVLEGLGGNDVLRVRDGRDNDTADGGTGSDTCQRDPGDTVMSCP